MLNQNSEGSHKHPVQDLRHRSFEPPLADPRALPSLGLKPGAESQPARQNSGPGSVDVGYRAHAAAARLRGAAEESDGFGTRNRLYTERRGEETGFPVFVAEKVGYVQC